MSAPAPVQTLSATGPAVQREGEEETRSRGSSSSATPARIRGGAGAGSLRAARGRGPRKRKSRSRASSCSARAKRKRRCRPDVGRLRDLAVAARPVRRPVRLTVALTGLDAVSHSFELFRGRPAPDRSRSWPEPHRRTAPSRPPCASSHPSLRAADTALRRVRGDVPAGARSEEAALGHVHTQGASMPTYLSPGVYVEEVAAGSRPIEGVGTAVAAFVGLAEDGAVQRADPGQQLDPVHRRPSATSSPGSYLAQSVYGYFHERRRQLLRRPDRPGRRQRTGAAQRAAPRSWPPARSAQLGRLKVTALDPAAAAGRRSASRSPTRAATSPTEDMFKLVVKARAQVVEEFDRANFGRGKQNVATDGQRRVQGRSSSRTPAAAPSCELANGETVAGRARRRPPPSRRPG